MPAELAKAPRVRRQDSRRHFAELPVFYREKPSAAMSDWKRRKDIGYNDR